MKRIALAMLLLGCGSTAGAELSLPLIAGGVSDARTFTTDDGWTVSLDDARVAFGPAYFCASRSADLELCPTALAELRGAVTIDALDGTTDTLATIEARTGTVRSAMWDYGRPFLLAASEPSPIAGAVDGEHSARFAGTASNGAVSFRFVAVLDISRATSGLAAVTASRTEHTLVDEMDALTVLVDTRAIVGRLDFDALAALAVDGEVQIREGDVAYDTLVFALTSSAVPALSWARPETIP